MRKHIHYRSVSEGFPQMFGFILLSMMLLQSCTEKCETRTEYTFFEPVYTTLAEIKAQTGLRDPQPITGVGKIYVYGMYLFVNDPGKGIHIIDNSVPSNPQAKSFLSIPGNYDLAITNSVLYADSYIDLVAFDISNVQSITEVNRIENAFYYFNSDIGFVAEPGMGIITAWAERKDVQVSEADCGSFNGSVFVRPMFNGVVANDAIKFRESLASTPGNGSGPGVGGSMAKFTISGSYLYTLNAGSVQPFDITAETTPVPKDKLYVGWDIETIFPYENNLFLGASSGMHILDITTPDAPTVISTYQHITSCDPVVVNDKFAFVTLRSGTECQGFTNQLEVINIENLQAPELVKIYPMTNPHGLGIDNNLLFVCDGADGLKVYDATDVTRIDENMLKHYKSIDAFDVIPYNKVLIMIGNNGLFQYDYSDPTDIKLLSHLQINGN